MKSLCVYLGANFGNHPLFTQAVITLANEIVKKDLTLIYGGSSMGLMGLLATTIKENGGKVIGVTTSQLLKKEIPLETLDALHIVETMQERKLWMQQHADAFVVMPGGLGTLEEALETWNAIKIGLLSKPLGFLNIQDYFKHLLEFIETCTTNEFISQEQAKIPQVSSDPKLLLDQLDTQHLQLTGL
ncbi:MULTISPECIES: TIGR00730 family Rossman fold protein [Legionella]|uniref:Cytokinin riboside 5'-monophosphate phosphoribohydrolase n=1 Tax=Legionella drozanskii LLAP-1 TaxID=1212489 RepID=A0A0W0TAM9_9GAMM|nr:MULTISPECIES: TIGR00730 family Rossman fold protein [Legionella]KTC92592.1 lysine decarboxylase [Legionella drozanskii LLAP-1]PJE12291.1 MAG: TIGR00730 family Rossman fold protein [Legionella sp.]